MAVTLNQLIDQVRVELLSAREANTPEAMYPFLFIEEVELEVAVTLSSSAQAGGKVNIEVVELGAKLNATDKEMHRITVKLTPLFTKDETRKQLEQRVGSRMMQRVEDTNIQATAKDLD